MQSEAPFEAQRARLFAVLKTIGIVALVLLILLLAIPLGISMVMGPCPECSSIGTVAMSICLAVLVGLVVLAILGTSTLLSFTPEHKMLLLARSLERPPRFA